MADNASFTYGTVAADDVSGVLYQRVKPAFGADGIATDVSATDPLPVVQTGTPGLPTGAATAANQSTGNTSLASILAKLSADPATQTTLAAILAKLTADPSTATLQGTANTKLDTLAGYLDGVEALLAAATPAGTNNIGGIFQIASALAGGISLTSRILSAAASTNATSVKASAGRIYAIQGCNAAAGIRYLKLYNKASAPAVGTDAPIKTIAIPASAGFALDWPVGYSFSTGIALALTTGSADSDTGAVSAGDILGLNVDYA